jgi:hypothetical protein
MLTGAVDHLTNSADMLSESTATTNISPFRNFMLSPLINRKERS